jgi:hypothetical protein
MTAARRLAGSQALAAVGFSIGDFRFSIAPPIPCNRSSVLEGAAHDNSDYLVGDAARTRTARKM